MTAFELFHPDWWLVINSFILLKGTPHYHPDINPPCNPSNAPPPSHEKLPSSQDFLLRLHRLIKLKGSASDTLRIAHPPKKRGGRGGDELCKISLNTAFAEDGVPHAHCFQCQARELHYTPKTTRQKWLPTHRTHLTLNKSFNFLFRCALQDSSQWIIHKLFVGFDLALACFVCLFLSQSPILTPCIEFIEIGVSGTLVILKALEEVWSKRKPDK